MGRLVSDVSKGGLSTLLAYNKTANPKDYDSENPNAIGILEVVEWSKTARGGRQYDMFFSQAPDTESCSSIYGLCE